MDKALGKELPEGLESKLAMLCNRLPTWDEQRKGGSRALDEQSHAAQGLCKDCSCAVLGLHMARSVLG